MARRRIRVDKTKEVSSAAGVAGGAIGGRSRVGLRSAGAGAAMTPARRFSLKVLAGMPSCRAQALPLIPEASRLAAWSAIWELTTVRPRRRRGSKKTSSPCSR